MVQLRACRGGHGWRDNPVSRIREGLRWLDSDAEAEPLAEMQPLEWGPNLLVNACFEKGTEGWRVIDNSGTLVADAEASDTTEGKSALHLNKIGGAPVDLVRQDIGALPEGKAIQASAWVKAVDAGNAWVKFFVYGRDGEVIHEDVELLQVRGTFDWREVKRTWPRSEGASHAVFMVVMVMGGEVWVDDVRVTLGK